MAAAAHNPAFAKKAGIPQGVAMEYNSADKNKMYASALRGGNGDNSGGGRQTTRTPYQDPVPAKRGKKRGTGTTAVGGGMGAGAGGGG